MGLDPVEWVACEIYMARERLASQFGQVATGRSWLELSESARRLQIAVVHRLIETGVIDVNRWAS